MTHSVYCVAAPLRTRLNSSMNSRNGVDFRPDEGGRYIVKTRTIDAARTWRITTSRPSKDWAGMGVVGNRWTYALYTTPTPPSRRSLRGRWRKLYMSVASTTASSVSVSRVSVRQITSTPRTVM